MAVDLAVRTIQCIYSEFCGAHTNQLFDLSLKTSQIPGAGKGLFTTKAIKKNANITRYTGDIKTLTAYNANPSGYAVEIPRGRVIDGVSTQSALGRYVNHCRSVNKKAGHCKGNNARYVISNRDDETIIWVRAIKNIPANSEIFVSYGRNYWREDAPKKAPKAPKAPKTVKTVKTAPKTAPKARPRRDGYRNTYHCYNKGKKNSAGGSVCPGICPAFYLGSDKKLYCSWCLPDTEKKTAPAVTPQDWKKIKEK